MTLSVGQIGILASTSPGTPFSTTATGSPTTTGSGFIVAVVTTNSASDVTAVSDTFSNIYVQATRIVDTQNTFCFERWYVANGTGGASHQAIVTLSSNQCVFAALIEVKGAATTNAAFYGAPNDTVYAFPTAPPYSTSLSVTPPTSGAFLLSCLGVGNSSQSSPTLSESSGFTIIGQTNAQAGGQVPAIGYRVVTATTTYTPSWTSVTPAGVAGTVTINSFMGAPPSSSAAIAWVT